MLFEMFNQSGFFAKLTLLMGVPPLVCAAWYARRPAERTLALLRALSLASMAGAGSGVAVGVIVVLRGIAATPEPHWPRALMGASEALAPAFLNLGFLAVAWLLVAAGILRKRDEPLLPD